ncbi:hypothetical protein B0I37DRAFT_103635 [Chaetomium sp. MPI-CAGE-AT-0009]|nr:hypothetical protein B0I37DRAFT_103635 [Chaetomium sp. MPI-CAGE-AT-0009]
MGSVPVSNWTLPRQTPSTVISKFTPSHGAGNLGPDRSVGSLNRPGFFVPAVRWGRSRLGYPSSTYFHPALGQWANLLARLSDLVQRPFASSEGTASRIWQEIGRVAHSLRTLSPFWGSLSPQGRVMRQARSVGTWVRIGIRNGREPNRGPQTGPRSAFPWLSLLPRPPSNSTFTEASTDIVSGRVPAIWGATARSQPCEITGLGPLHGVV